MPDTRTDFGVEGCLVMLVGNRAPYRAKYTPTETERVLWERHRAEFNAVAQDALDVKDSLAFVRHPGWAWHAG